MTKKIDSNRSFKIECIRPSKKYPKYLCIDSSKPQSTYEVFLKKDGEPHTLWRFYEQTK